MKSSGTAGPRKRRGRFPVCPAAIIVGVSVLLSYAYLASVLLLASHSSRRAEVLSVGDVFPDRAHDNFLPRILVLVFPQFHQDPLNDQLWEEGFTDWDNLRNSPERNRLGFKIPRPTELGYYDYANLEPRKKQGELAKRYGIDGLVFHHYWFYDETHPGPNLHAPLVNMLKDGHPDMPFALHWCASKWTSTWSGKVRPDFVFPESGVLQKQFFPDPATEKDGMVIEHYDWLKQFFHHPNYIKVDGKPLLMMYQKKPGSFPVLKRLKELAVEDGFPGLYYTVGLTKPHDHLLDIGDLSQWNPRPQMTKIALSKYKFDKVVSYPNPTEWNEKRNLEVPGWCTGGERDLQKERIPDIAGIISSFDNTPRRNYDEANLWSSDEPAVVVERFRKSLHAALYYESCCFVNDMEERLKKEKDNDDRFILINAMNEWAEGMAMEPSDVYGRRFLETILDTKKAIIQNGCTL